MVFSAFLQFLLLFCFLDFPLPSSVSSAAAAGAGSVDDDAVDACGAGVLDRNRCGVPLNDAGSDAIRRPVPLKGSGPGVLLRPLVGLGTSMLSMGGSAGVGSERSLFATLAEGPLLLAFAFAAGCAEGALLAGLSFSASCGAGGSLLFFAGALFKGSLLRDLVFLSWFLTRLVLFRALLPRVLLPSLVRGLSVLIWLLLGGFCRIILLCRVFRLIWSCLV